MNKKEIEIIKKYLDKQKIKVVEKYDFDRKKVKYSEKIKGWKKSFELLDYHDLTGSDFL